MWSVFGTLELTKTLPVKEWLPGGSERAKKTTLQRLAKTTPASLAAPGTRFQSPATQPQPPTMKRDEVCAEKKKSLVVASPKGKVLRWFQLFFKIFDRFCQS